MENKIKKLSNEEKYRAIAYEVNKQFILNEYDKIKSCNCNIYSLKHRIQEVTDIYYSEEEYTKILEDMGFKVKNKCVNISTKRLYKKIEQSPYVPCILGDTLPIKAIKNKYNKLFSALSTIYEYDEGEYPKIYQEELSSDLIKEFNEFIHEAYKTPKHPSCPIDEIVRQLNYIFKTEITELQLYMSLDRINITHRDNFVGISPDDVWRIDDYLKGRTLWMDKNIIDKYDKVFAKININPCC